MKISKRSSEAVNKYTCLTSNDFKAIHRELKIKQHGRHKQICIFCFFNGKRTDTTSVFIHLTTTITNKLLVGKGNKKICKRITNIFFEKGDKVKKIISFSVI